MSETRGDRPTNKVLGIEDTTRKFKVFRGHLYQ